MQHFRDHSDETEKTKVCIQMTRYENYILFYEGAPLPSKKICILKIEHFLWGVFYILEGRATTLLHIFMERYPSFFLNRFEALFEIFFSFYVIAMILVIIVIIIVTIICCIISRFYI